LAQIRTEINQAQAPAGATAQTAGSEVSRTRAAAQEAAARAARARRTLAVATERRLGTDHDYQAHRTTRFQFHLARSREILAEVELHHAEEEAEATRQAFGAATGADD